MIKHSLLLLFLILPGSLTHAQEEVYSVKKTSFSSDRYDEFSPVYYRRGLVFCSDQNSNLLFSYSTSQNKGLFKINYTDTLRNDVNLFSASLTSRFNDGPVTFSPGGDTIYYSRNLVVDGGPKELSGARNKLGLFYAVSDGDNWKNINELRFNSDSYNITTPYLSPDGRFLFFASDKPDGLGGSDLFFCRWNNGYWSNPENLGPSINTKGNEAYPFVNQKGELFFSSDGHEGLGGKDIFFSKFVNSGWTRPVRLEAPVNSVKDDFGFISDESGTRGYFSSNRGSSIDIYSFYTTVPQFLYCGEQDKNIFCFDFPDDISIDINPLNLQFEWDFGNGKKETGYVVANCFTNSGKHTVSQKIIDKKTGKLVFNKLKIELEIKDEEQPFIKADEFVQNSTPVSFDARNSNLPGKTNLSYYWNFGDGGKSTGEVVNHSFNENGEYIVKLGVRFKDEGSGKVSQECVSTKIIVTNEITDSSGIVINDTSGMDKTLFNISDHRNIDVDTIYSVTEELGKKAIFQVVIQSSKSQISLKNISFEPLAEKYTLREKYVTEDDVFNYVIDEGINFMDIYPSYSEAVAMGFKNSVITTYLSPDSMERELWNLVRTYGASTDDYFQGKASRLGSDNFPALDRLADLLKNSPGTLLKIAVHTDNTGSPATNLSLSNNRARSIVAYLVEKGVSSTRLIPSGYGSTRPIAANYSEADRKKNRRLELIIMNYQQAVNK